MGKVLKLGTITDFIVSFNIGFYVCTFLIAARGVGEFAEFSPLSSPFRLVLGEYPDDCFFSSVKLLIFSSICYFNSNLSNFFLFFLSSLIVIAS